MTDRTSTIAAGIFQLSIDRDHKGNYRGRQSMVPGKYRGWHYHVTSEKFTPIEVMNLLEQCLLSEGATRVDMPTKLCIGYIEKAPARVACFEKDKLGTILWISSKTGTLHVETNKDDDYIKGLVTKKMLVRFCTDITRYYHACKTFEGLLDRLVRLGESAKRKIEV